MELKLFKMTNEKIAVTKTLTNEHSMNGTLRDECSIIDPVIMVEGGSSIASYNYAYIPEFNRYYFIKDCVSVRNNLWRLSMHVDVLYTYKSEIRNQKAIVSRNAKKYNLYLTDPMFKAYVNPVVKTLAFSGGFPNNFVHILATNGGGSDE